MCFCELLLPLMALNFFIVKHKTEYFYCVAAFFLCCSMFGQEITLFQQFNGRFDFTIIGNTLNTEENLGLGNSPCIINTESSAVLHLQPGETVEKAILYWAGSGNGDFEVNLNDEPIVPDETFNLIQSSSGLIFFSARKDVTEQVIATGNGNYTLSNLDLSEVIPAYCQNATNFAGWAIAIIYKNDSLPLNQLNLYSGLDYVSSGHTTLTFNLDNLNVIDDVGAKIGFLAWEGDRNIAIGEKLLLNGNELSSPINPANNVFNGTNSITGSTTLYNMDIDVYDIQDNIAIGDVSAEIKLTSSQDFVMVNTVITKLNSQLPDATITVENLRQECDSRLITIDYTVSNFNSTDELASAVPIAVYADGIYIEYAETTLPIPIGESQSAIITLNIPVEIPNEFTLEFIVDMTENGTGNHKEILETNNSFSIPVTLWTSPLFNTVPDIESCNEGLGKGTFDFSGYDELVKADANDTVAFYKTPADAANQENEIFTTSDFVSEATPNEIFIRIENENCHSITSFRLLTRKCPPKVYNLVEPSSNGFYDSLQIDGLRDIFVNFNLSIYNRWGNLVWKGNNKTESWKGDANEGTRILGNQLSEGTYYYILELNDPDYPNPMNGFIYLKR